MTTDLIFNRYRPDSIAGRILAALAKRPHTPAELARIAQSRSADNILAAGGWYSQLRRFGKTTRKFSLELADDGRLVLTVNKRYASQVGGGR